MAAYNKIKPALYNEIDAYAAQWLRNLIAAGHIAAGHIAPGDVDERSIMDVSPDDLRGYTQFHTFAGIGVWSYALRMAGWPDDRPVWTGSCPCQPFSSAGKGGGFDDERHLWPYWHHLIRVCRPSNVFGEQVASKDGLGWLDLVQPDLEGEGYAFGAQDRCSAGFGAPHIRQRLYFAGATGMAHPNGAISQLVARPRPRTGEAPSTGTCDQFDGPGEVRGLAYTTSFGGRAGLRGDDPTRRWRSVSGDDSSLRWLADAGCGSDERVRRCGFTHGADGPAENETQERERRRASAGDCESVHWLANDDHAFRRPDRAGGHFSNGEEAGRDEGASHAFTGGRPRGLEHADIPFSREERQQRSRQLGGIGGDQGAGPAEFGPGPVNGPWSDADWLFCRDGKWRPVESGTFPLAHGATSRVGRLRAYGNAIDAENARDFIDTYLEAEASGFAPLVGGRSLSPEIMGLLS